MIKKIFKNKSIKAFFLLKKEKKGVFFKKAM